MGELRRPGHRQLSWTWVRGGSGIFTPDVHEERSRELVADRDVECFLCTTVDTGSGYIREKRGLSWRRLQWYKPMVEANRTLARV